MKRIIFLLFITSSFDIFLNLNINSFHIRFFYLIEFLSISVMIVSLIYENRFPKLKVIGGIYIFLYFLILLLFVYNSPLLLRSIGYILWFMLSIFLIPLVSFFWVRNVTIEYQLYDYFIFSFFVLSIIGLIQFILGILGIDFFITQWWIDDKLPRLNGFSYEPSYYATYLCIGWFSLVYLYFNNRNIALKYKVYLISITLTIILSSSRMALLIMTLSLLYLLLCSIFSNIKRFKVSNRDFYILTFILIFSFGVLFVFICYFDELKFLLAGTGIFGTSDHSSGTRAKEAIDTFNIFLKSPFIGYSLGGIAPAIAELRGVIISSQEEAKNFEGMNVILENLAAGGAIGFCFFFLYFSKVFSFSKKIANQLKNINANFSYIILSLRFSLFWEFVLLCFNQNILRPYFWILVAMLNGSIFVGLYLLNNRKV